MCPAVSLQVSFLTLGTRKLVVEDKGGEKKKKKYHVYECWSQTKCTHDEAKDHSGEETTNEALPGLLWRELQGESEQE